jgi:hypothetical protein
MDRYDNACATNSFDNTPMAILVRGRARTLLSVVLLLIVVVDDDENENDDNDNDGNGSDCNADGGKDNGDIAP